MEVSERSSKTMRRTVRAVSAKERADADHASHEAVRPLIVLSPRPCSLVPSVTTPLYSTTVSQPLRADTLEECLPAPATHEDEGAPENVEVGDTSVLTRFTANREYTSITLSEPRG